MDASYVRRIIEKTDGYLEYNSMQRVWIAGWWGKAYKHANLDDLYRLLKAKGLI